MELIIRIYISTIIIAVIAFILNYTRLDRYYRKQGMRAVFNIDSAICLSMCFIPIINIKFTMLYWNGAFFTDEEMKESLQDENDE